MNVNLVRWTCGCLFVFASVMESRADDEGLRLTLNVAPAHSVVQAGEKQNVWLRVGITGFELKRAEQRPPVNLAIVLDRSGSMQGDKIARAREGAIDALSLLNERDIVSIITYDSSVEVIVPATRLTDKADIIAKIRALQPGGNTALFAGVSKGVAEVRKFAEKEYVNRVILLSDGLANVGPSSPGELGALGSSLKKENISVSTLGLGLGYNEDLMVQLAAQSGGNHHFIENASELVDIFRREFEDVLSVVAQEVDVQITIPEGLRPIRVLGNDADINGQKIVTRMAQVYSRQMRYVVVELEVPGQAAGAALELATVSVGYTNMHSHAAERLEGGAAVRFSDSASEVTASLNKSVMADVVALIASEKNKLATQLLDQGDLMGCRTILQENSAYLRKYSVTLDSASLDLFGRENERQLDALKDVDAPTAPGAVSARKGMRAIQNAAEFQQSIKSPSSAAPSGAGAKP